MSSTFFFFFIAHSLSLSLPKYLSSTWSRYQCCRGSLFPHSASPSSTTTGTFSTLSLLCPHRATRRWRPIVVVDLCARQRLLSFSSSVLPFVFFLLLLLLLLHAPRRPLLTPPTNQPIDRKPASAREEVENRDKIPGPLFCCWPTTFVLTTRHTDGQRGRETGPE